MPRVYRSPLRRESAAQTRAAIVRAARDVLAGGQLEMPEVARRAGVALPTVYRHFPSKDSLLGELMADAEQPFAALADRLPSVEVRAVRLLQGIRGALAALEEHRELLWAAHRMAPESLAMQGVAARVGQSIEGIAAVISREATSSLPPEQASALLSTVAGLLHPLTYQGMRGSGMSAGQIEQHVIGVITRVMGGATGRV